MTQQTERATIMAHQEQRIASAFRDVINRVPEAVAIASLETEDVNIARTPEGKFALTYLLASRDLLKPTLSDLTNIPSDFLFMTGGSPHNPERNIDAVGAHIVRELSRQSPTLPHLWMHTEENAHWENVSATDTSPTEGTLFAVVDPVDMTSSIPRGIPVQTTGIALYDRNGGLKTVGIMSLVDEGFIFIENVDGTLHIAPHGPHQPDRDTSPTDPLRIAAKTRRLHILKNTKLFRAGNVWAMDCDSGYATLGLWSGEVDTALDHQKGSQWEEVVIWQQIAQSLGFPVTDSHGTPLDLSAIMRRVINKHEVGDAYRIPFVMSRTPEIHKRVLELLKVPQQPAR